MSEPELRSGEASGVDAKELARIERLRDRTDEIELIISGLTTVALFTLPGWLFDAVSAAYAHGSWASSQAIEILLVIAPGLFYGLGACFAVHLMIRAYWAGLVGLRSVYPGGIVWERVPGVGRLTRAHYERRLPDLSQAITSADHAASGLFSVISMTALGMLWISAWMVAVLLASQVVGAALGDAERGVQIGLTFLMVLFVGAPASLWFFDSLLGKRFSSLSERASFRRLVDGLIRINAWIWPQRLILPVQLTLQTNTRPYLFSLMIAMGTAGILFLGFLRYEAWTQFSVSDEFRYLDTAAVRDGIDSAHYEHLRGPLDRLRPVPTIHHFEQRGAFLRVFLPYHPVRDNPVLDARCSGDAEALDCLRGLWSIRLEDRVVASEQLLATERRDLNQRGLTGVVSLQGLLPGLHVLVIDWNGGEASSAVAPGASGRSYRVPFLFSPDQELGAAQLGDQVPRTSGNPAVPF